MAIARRPESVFWWTAGQHPTVPTIYIPTCLHYCLLFVRLLNARTIATVRTLPTVLTISETNQLDSDACFRVVSCPVRCVFVCFFPLTPSPPPPALRTSPHRLPVNPAHASRLFRPPGREGWQKPGREAAGGLRETLHRPERLLRDANRMPRRGRRPPSRYRGGKGPRREREKYRGWWRHAPRT